MNAETDGARSSAGARSGSGSCCSSARSTTSTSGWRSGPSGGSGSRCRWRSSFSGLWHLARTWAWAWCFPQPRTVSFARLARVRLAAEAFSYLTLRGIAGEPLKVVLLGDTVDARQATAAVALERLAYLIGTTIIVGVGSILAIVLAAAARACGSASSAASPSPPASIAFLTGDRDCRARHLPAVVARRARPRCSARRSARGRVARFVGGGRAADARARARQSQAPRRPARRHVRGLRLHGARGVGHSARLGDRRSR